MKRENSVVIFSFQSLLLGTSVHNDKIKIHTSSKALDTLNMVDYQGISLIFPICDWACENRAYLHKLHMFRK